MMHQVKTIIVNILCFFLYYTGLVRIYRVLFPRKQITILFFHHVPRRPFDKCMHYLSRLYNIATLDKLIELHENRKSIPNNTVILTFDDGYSSNYYQNFPVLQKYGIAAIGFLTVNMIGGDGTFWWDQLIYALNHTHGKTVTIAAHTWPLRTRAEKRKAIPRILHMIKQMPDAQKNNTVDSVITQLNIDRHDAQNCNPMMSWEQVRDMNDKGVQFGAHTLHHPILTRVPLVQAQEEICKARDILAEQLDKPVRFFAYPSGEHTDFNEDVKRLVRDAGFECALTTIPGRVDLNSDLFALKRIPITANVNLPVFAVTLAGLSGNYPIWY